MDIEFDSSYILYGAGVLFAIITFVYFAQQLVFDLAPFTRSASLFLLFALLFILGNHLYRETVGKVFYILSAASYIVFLVYTVTRFEFTTNQVFAVLGFSALLFLGLGHLVKKKGRFIDRKTFKYLIVFLISVLALILLFDVFGGQPEFELELYEEINFEEGSRSDIGFITVRNPFFLSREYEVPSYEGCLFVPEEEIDEQPVMVRYSDHSLSSGTIEGNGEIEVSIEADLRDYYRITNTTRVEDVGIEFVDECPEESNRKALFVYLRNPEGTEEIMFPAE